MCISHYYHTLSDKSTMKLAEVFGEENTIFNFEANQVSSSRGKEQANGGVFVFPQPFVLEPHSPSVLPPTNPLFPRLLPLLHRRKLKNTRLL